MFISDVNIVLSKLS